MKDRTSPINLNRMLELIVISIQKLPSTVLVDNRGWVYLLQAKFKLAGMPNQESVIAELGLELVLELTQVFDDIEAFYHELKGDNADKKQAHLEQLLPTAKEELAILKDFCDRFWTKQEGQAIEEGILFKTDYRNNNLGVALATLTCGINACYQKPQKPEAEESKRVASFAASYSGTLQLDRPHEEYSSCIESARIFTGNKAPNIMAAYKKVLTSLEQGQRENAIIKLIEFSHFLDKKYKEPIEKMINTSKTKLTAKAKNLIDDIKKFTCFCLLQHHGQHISLTTGVNLHNSFSRRYHK